MDTLRLLSEVGLLSGLLSHHPTCSQTISHLSLPVLCVHRRLVSDSLTAQVMPAYELALNICA